MVIMVSIDAGKNGIDPGIDADASALWCKHTAVHSPCLHGLITAITLALHVNTPPKWIEERSIHFWCLTTRTTPGPETSPTLINPLGPSVDHSYMAVHDPQLFYMKNGLITIVSQAARQPRHASQSKH